MVSTRVRVGKSKKASRFPPAGLLPRHKGQEAYLPEGKIDFAIGSYLLVHFLE